MRIEQLITFDKVVQYSSFTKAASELYTTQPSVSKMIDALEDELGRQLVRRTSRGIELTPFGKRVYSDVKVILQMVNSWRDYDCAGKVRQEVHIQSTSTMCNFLSADFLGRLHENHPCIDVFLHECRKTEIIHQMEELGIHIGLLPLRNLNPADVAVTLERLRKNGWEFHTVIKDPICIFVSAENPLAGQETVWARDLSRLALGTYTTTNDDNWLLFGQYFNGDASYRRHSKEAILQYVAQDRCAAIFPRFTSRYEYLLEQEKIVPIAVKDLDLGYAEFLLVCQSGKSMLEAEQEVVQSLKQYFRELEL